MQDVIEVSISAGGAEVKHQLRLFAIQRILELLSAAGGRSLERQFVESTILEEFKSAGRWHPDLDAAIKNQNKTHAQVMIHWARGDLFSDGIIQKSKSGDDRYVLMCSVSRVQAFYQEEKILGFEAIVARGTARKRKATILKESDSVYVIIDPRHPEWCKVGAGRGDCVERLAEARRWTRKEARVTHVFRIGPGHGRSVESAAHRILKQHFEKQLEWFRCTAEQAATYIHKAALTTKARRIVELDPAKLAEIERLADAELQVIE